MGEPETVEDPSSAVEEVLEDPPEVEEVLKDALEHADADHKEL